MPFKTRRDFLAVSGKLLVGTVALGSIGAQAMEEQAQTHGGSALGLVVDAASKNVCATCQFWGGMRRISGDKTRVATQSMGWCNNPDSPNHEKLTPADHQMKKPGIWVRWSAL